MKRGFVAEIHVVVYCDCCGDTYSEHEAEGICFDSIPQAVSYLNDRSAQVGWVYDGDRVLCDACRAIERDEHDNTDLTEETEK